MKAIGTYETGGYLTSISAFNVQFNLLAIDIDLNIYADFNDMLSEFHIFF